MRIGVKDWNSRNFAHIDKYPEDKDDNIDNQETYAADVGS
jgi:hypothetical protein